MFGLAPLASVLPLAPLGVAHLPLTTRPMFGLAPLARVNGRLVSDTT